MRQFLTESCIDKLLQAAIGVGVVGLAGASGGLAGAIGAGQLAVAGLAGLGAMAAGRAIQSRIREDEAARAVLDAVVREAGKVWLATGTDDAEVACDVVRVLDDGLDRLDFPVTSIPAIRDAAGQDDGLHAALADAMLAKLDDPFGLLSTDRHRALARDILTDAVRAGVLASATLRDETILAVADMAVRIGRETLAATREEGAQTRAEMAAMAAELLTAFQQSDRSAQAREAHLTRLVIIQLARRIAEDVSDFDTALAELDRAVTIAIDVQKDPARYGNVSAVVREVLSRMASLSGEGRHDEAADLATREFANWERAEQDRQDAARQQGLALLEAGLKQDILRRDADAAAARIERMVQLQSMTDALSGALREAAVEWMERGRDQGLNFDLAVAIALARRLIRLSSGPDQSGDAQNLLGSALQTLGERESGTGRLKAAVATFRAALQERARERVPLEWAATQNNLGTALATLGARESGTMQLEEAAMAFSAALEEYNRERFPLDWAMTQNNLGNALSTLGARENGTGRLEEAVAAYREALEVRTRERMPLHWAMTQNNLGTALATLGERESGTMRLEEAVMAFCAALEEYNSERVPLDWAMTQNNLGNALSTLGTRESGTGRLEEAVAAYRAALGEYTRERVPLDWAASTGGLARARALIARRTGDCALAREAVAALEEVLAVVQAAEHGPYLSYFATVLTMARAVVAKVCG